MRKQLLMSGVSTAAAGILLLASPSAGAARVLHPDDGSCELADVSLVVHDGENWYTDIRPGTPNCVGFSFEFTQACGYDCGEVPLHWYNVYCGFDLFEQPLCGEEGYSCPVYSEDPLNACHEGGNG
jgi:hypothetical protein